MDWVLQVNRKFSGWDDGGNSDARPCVRRMRNRSGGLGVLLFEEILSLYPSFLYFYITFKELSSNSLSQISFPSDR